MCLWMSSRMSIALPSEHEVPDAVLKNPCSADTACLSWFSGPSDSPALSNVAAGQFCQLSSGGAGADRSSWLLFHQFEEVSHHEDFSLSPDVDHDHDHHECFCGPPNDQPSLSLLSWCPPGFSQAWRLVASSFSQAGRTATSFDDT